MSCCPPRYVLCSNVALLSGTLPSVSACNMTFDPVEIAEGKPGSFWHVNDACDVKVALVPGLPFCIVWRLKALKFGKAWAELSRDSSHRSRHVTIPGPLTTCTCA